MYDEARSAALVKAPKGLPSRVDDDEPPYHLNIRARDYAALKSNTVFISISTSLCRALALCVTGSVHGRGEGALLDEQCSLCESEGRVALGIVADQMCAQIVVVYHNRGYSTVYFWPLLASRYVRLRCVLD